MKRKCGSIRDLLGAYADNELDQARADQVVRHLETCADCRRELDQILELSRLAKGVEHPKLAEDYWDWHRTRVWRGLRERRRALTPYYRPSFAWPRLAAAAAGFVVVLVVVLAGWRTLLPRPGAAGRALSEPKTMSESPVASVPAVGRSAESDAAKKITGGAALESEGRTDALAQVPATSVRDEEKTSVGFAAKGVGAGSTSKPSAVPAARGVVPKIEVAAERHREELAAVPSPSGERIGVSSDAEKGRVVSGPVLVGSPPGYAAAPDTGTVLLSVRTDSTGRVVSAVVSRSSGSAKLDSLAVRQMLQSRFKAAVKNNRRVASSFEYPFHIQKKPARSAKRDRPTADRANPDTRQNQPKGKQSDKQSGVNTDKSKVKQPDRQSDDDSDRPSVKQPDRQPDNGSDRPKVRQPDRQSDGDSDRPDVKQPDGQPGKLDGNQEDKQPEKQPSKPEGEQSDTPEDSQPGQSIKEKTKK